jgi:hypothetical protein
MRGADAAVPSGPATGLSFRLSPHGVSLSLLGLLILVAAMVASGEREWGRAPAPAESSYGKLPLSFVPNRGQADERVLYSAQAGGSSLQFTRDRVAITLEGKDKAHALHLRFLGASPSPTLTGEDRQKGRVNYFTANASQTNIPTYGELRYRNLWPGIDLAFRGEGGRLKYEFHVAAGADPSKIRLAYAGAESLSLGAAGALLIETPLGTLRDQAPKSYQRSGSRKVPVESSYATAGNRYGFELGPYDRSRPLVIDPGLVYSTFLGAATGWEIGDDIAVDGAGNAYVAGTTASSDFPTTPGAFDSTPGSNWDVFVTKLSPDGSTLVYSSYLGGIGPERGQGIAVDPGGRAFVIGWTGSPDFPTTSGAFDTSYADNGSDAFVTKLSADGSNLAYSTFLGGSLRDTGASEDAVDVAIDDAGNAYVTGWTYAYDFPVTPGAYQTINDDLQEGFVTKLNPSGSALVWSTYFGGTHHERPYGIAVDENGNPYVSGVTDAQDYPTTPGAYRTTGATNPWGGRTDDGFVTKFANDGSSLVYSTYFTLNPFQEIAVDDQGAVYTASADKLSPDGSTLVYSVAPFFGVTGYDVVVDSDRNAYITGATSGNLPVTSGAYDTTPNGSSDAFVEKLDPTGFVLYASYLGGSAERGDGARGIAIDSARDAYLAGETYSSNFPTTPGSFDTTYNGGPTDSTSSDAFVSKIDIPDAFGVIRVVKDAGPDDPQNFNFQAGGGLTPSTFTLDDDSDPTLPNTRTFDVPIGSGYSVAETQPAGWYLGSASCDDGSPTNNIDVAESETVTCTFINSRHYPRPGGASPLRVPLVPAFRLCGIAQNPQNSNHVAPLALDSCAPPLEASEVLTTSTTGKMAAFARLRVLPGNPATPTIDEADVAIDMSATDVKNASDGSDFAGTALLSTVIRVTDRANSPGGVSSATSENLTFSLPVDCAATPDPNTGALCSLETTADTVVPGFAIEGKRAIVETFSLRFRDPGPDGVILPPAGGLGCPPECGSGDERTFLDQGLFLP